MRKIHLLICSLTFFLVSPITAFAVCSDYDVAPNAAAYSAYTGTTLGLASMGNDAEPVIPPFNQPGSFTPADPTCTCANTWELLCCAASDCQFTNPSYAPWFYNPGIKPTGCGGAISGVWTITTTCTSTSTCGAGQFDWAAGTCTPPDLFGPIPGQDCGGTAWTACSFGCCACPGNLTPQYAALSYAQKVQCGLAPSPLPSPTSTPPSGTCTTTPPGTGAWADHVCGTGGCATSAVPVPAPTGLPAPFPPGVTFDKLANPMAACCGTGWGENGTGGSKLDCVEARAPAAPAIQSFETFYSAGAAANDLTTGGLIFPNRMFVLGDDGVPLNGFYRQSGTRCRYRNPSTLANVTLSASDQMALIDRALTERNPPAGLGYLADVDPECCNLVTFALERNCPVQDSANGVRIAKTDGTVRRCTAASEMKLHFGLIDLCDPTRAKRGRFRPATSFTSEDVRYAVVVQTSAVTLENLVRNFYPRLPSTPQACPFSPALRPLPYSNGMCGLSPP